MNMATRENTLFAFEHSRASAILLPKNNVAVEWYIDHILIARFCMDVDNSKRLYTTSTSIRAAAERIEQLIQGGWTLEVYECTATLGCPLTGHQLETFWYRHIPLGSTSTAVRPIRNMRHLQKMVSALQSHPDSPSLSSGGTIPRGDPGTIEHYVQQLQLPCEILYSDNHYAAVYRRTPVHVYRANRKRTYSFLVMLVYQDGKWRTLCRGGCAFRDKTFRREALASMQLFKQINPDDILFHDNNLGDFNIRQGERSETYSEYQDNWFISLRKQLEKQINQQQRIAPVPAATDSRPMPPKVAAVIQAQQEELPLLAHREVAKSGRNPLPDDFGQE